MRLQQTSRDARPDACKLLAGSAVAVTLCLLLASLMGVFLHMLLVNVAAHAEPCGICLRPFATGPASSMRCPTHLHKCRHNTKVGAACIGSGSCGATSRHGTCLAGDVYVRIECPHSARSALLLVLLSLGVGLGCLSRTALVVRQRRTRGSLLPTSTRDVAAAEIACGVPVIDATVVEVPTEDEGSIPIDHQEEAEEGGSSSAAVATGTRMERGGAHELEGQPAESAATATTVADDAPPQLQQTLADDVRAVTAALLPSGGAAAVAAARQLPQRSHPARRGGGTGQQTSAARASVGRVGSYAVDHDDAL